MGCDNFCGLVREEWQFLDGVSLDRDCLVRYRCVNGVNARKESNPVWVRGRDNLHRDRSR
jgi:hypothetical protein